MNKFRFSVNLLAFAAFTILLSAVAQAQATRTWVSGVGDDVNPCSRTAPCKTYAGAISKTARDGEISTLDPGGFGAITITKSITINGGGTGQGYGSILASGTNGVVINITDAADLRKTVRLNWLDINGAPSSLPGVNGVKIFAADTVHVENTNIDSFRSTTVDEGNGIRVTASATVRLFVRNTVIRNCIGSGILLNTSSGQVTASITNSKISSNANGIKVLNGGRLLVVGCEITNNSSVGVDSEQTTISTISNLDGNYIAFNGTGVQVGGGAAEVRISNNFIVQNATGLSITAGNLFSSGNNRVLGNTTNGAPNQPVVQPI